MRRTIFATFALVAISLASTHALALAGKYAVKGTNPGGKGNYTGTVTITQKGDLYQLAWSVGTTYTGVGIKSGNVLSVGWGTGGAAGYGVVSYTIGADGTLTGTWAGPKDTGLGTETLTPQK
ncbi:MAG: fibronectin-binding protein [Deltaproteobacteria bacterium]|nr:fibronectin-binding protein [Deltaproteobacteria bacterium]